MTLLLSISFSISNIVLRQIRITNINNESKPAFFIADSAIECVTYYDTLFIASSTDDSVNINKDFSLSIFGTSLADATGGANATIRCGNGLSEGAPLSLQKTVSGDSTKVVTTFDILYDTDMCASVEVTRTEIETNITARGYNTGINQSNDGCDLSDLDKRRIVERGLTVKY
jgi:hypothetical protein